MNKYIFYALFALLHTGSVQPNSTINLSPDDAQAQVVAHESFLKGDFAQALAIYQSLQHKSSALWQNMGSCYFNEQRYAQALLCWKRAYQGCSISQVAFLCSMEQKALGKLNLEVPSRFYCWVKRTVLMVPLPLLQLIFALLLCWVLYILSSCWRWQEIAQVDRRWLRWLLLGCLVCSCTWYVQRSFLQKDQAMVVKEDVLVYAGPERTFHIVEKLSAGSVVHVMQKKQGMYKITKHSLTGWVTQDTVEFIYNYE